MLEKSIKEIGKRPPEDEPEDKEETKANLPSIDIGKLQESLDSAAEKRRELQKFLDECEQKLATSRWLDGE